MGFGNIGVLISGSGSNLQSIIDKCESGELPAEVKVVISNKPGAYGLVRAMNHRIPAVFLPRIAHANKDTYNRIILQTLKEYGAELVVMAGYMRLLGSEVLTAYPNKVMNLHPALLPSFPGENGISDALDYGVKWTGVTVHFANEAYDEGPIILQEPVQIFEDDTEETLAERIHIVEHRLLPAAIKLYCENRLHIVGRRVIIKE